MLDLYEAAEWASEFIKKNVTPTNISYLIQYGKIQKHNRNGKTLVALEDLEKYYQEYCFTLHNKYEERLGSDVNWALSFSWVKEKETTKHVHRLHPYKGKFIPQLVEYFLDDHLDDFKKDVYFREGDIILDPFVGSGTTLVQANELGMHSIGLDISYFNCLISEVKLQDYDLLSVEKLCRETLKAMEAEYTNAQISYLERDIDNLVSELNKKYFPSPDYKYNLARGLVDEEKLVSEALADLKEKYIAVTKKYNFNPVSDLTGSEFLDTWFAAPVLKEALAARRIIDCAPEKERKLLIVMLSRAMRSCRVTPHYQLETLDEPVYEPYYCFKHRKICRPVLSLVRMFKKYCADTVKRLAEFTELKKNTYYALLAGDSRQLNIFENVKKINHDFYELLVKQKIKGIFTSPPYVGQLDYHEQHKYAYEFFGFPRRDADEIGKSSKGKSLKAREEYIQGISDVLINCRKFFADDFHIFIVANDEYGLYPEIAGRAGLKIVQEFKRPVLNRASRDKNPYGESVFHMVNFHQGN